MLSIKIAASNASKGRKTIFRFTAAMHLITKSELTISEEKSRQVL